MDYGRLNRRELQALCKQHGIPANKTNVFMAHALAALLNAPKESEQLVDAVPDPVEIVKSRAKQAARSNEVADVIQNIEVDDLSSLLAKSTLDADASEWSTIEIRNEDCDESAVEVISESHSLTIAAEAAKPSRRPRTQTSKTKSIRAILDAVPALDEPTLELVLPMKDTTNSLPSAVEDVVSAPILAYSRRVPQEKEPSNVVTPESSSGMFGNALFAEPDTNTTETVTPVEEMMVDVKVVTDQQEQRSGVATPDVGPAVSEKALVAETNNVVGEPLAPVEETFVDGKASTKTSKAKGRKPKKVKAISRIVLPVLEDGGTLTLTGGYSEAARTTPDSPTLGLAFDAFATNEVTQRRGSLGPAQYEEFEFQPVAESFAEIMTHGKALVGESKECQHRIGRKTGKSCKSCTSERKVACLVQEPGMVEVIDAEKVDIVPEAEAVPEAGKTEMLNTPVKDSDDKENSLKNVDLHSLSIRKLQKEVQRRGLSKRNNTRVKA